MPTLPLGQELPAPGEDAVFQQITRMIEGQLDKDYPAGTRPMRRDQHPKHHGAVRAELTVHDGLPDDLRVGLFRSPRRFKAWVRFSNGASQIKPDLVKDARGIAIKVCGVEGPKLLEDERDALTQDFLMINTPSFFLENAHDYIPLFKALEAKKPLRFFFPSLNPMRWKLKEFRAVSKVRTAIGNPLGVQYWSTVPFKYGERACRFSVRPVGLDTRLPPADPKPDPDYLRLEMAKTLAAQDVEFEFMVQLQTDPVRMPIEDPRVHWDQTESPYRKVATLKIPKQRFDSAAQMEFCEDLSYTPWHCLPEHRPLGGVNRARLPVYQAISKKRHAANGRPRTEPTGDETF